MKRPNSKLSKRSDNKKRRAELVSQCAPPGFFSFLFFCYLITFPLPCARFICCHFLCDGDEGGGEMKRHERRKKKFLSSRPNAGAEEEKNANLVLRLLIRITTENPPSFRIIFIILGASSSWCNAFSSGNYRRARRGRSENELKPPDSFVCHLIRFPSPFTLPSRASHSWWCVACFVYCFDWSVISRTSRHEKVSRWTMLSRISNRFLWREIWVLESTAVIRFVNFPTPRPTGGSRELLIERSTTDCRVGEKSNIT